MLRAWCAERLSDYKVPETMALTSEPLPRNANGKVLKRQPGARPGRRGRREMPGAGRAVSKLRPPAPPSVGRNRGEGEVAARLGLIATIHHHGIVWFSQRVNVPVGVHGPSSATRTASRAPSSTVSVPAYPLRFVL